MPVLRKFFLFKYFLVLFILSIYAYKKAIGGLSISPVKYKDNEISAAPVIGIELSNLRDSYISPVAIRI